MRGTSYLVRKKSATTYHSPLPSFLEQRGSQMPEKFDFFTSFVTFHGHKLHFLQCSKRAQNIKFISEMYWHPGILPEAAKWQKLAPEASVVEKTQKSRIICLWAQFKKREVARRGRKKKLNREEMLAYIEKAYYRPTVYTTTCLDTGTKLEQEITIMQLESTYIKIRDMLIHKTIAHMSESDYKNVKWKIKSTMNF